MRQAVVDASVAAKWVVEEAYSAQVALLLAFDARHAPVHWRAAAANVLWSKVFRGDLTATDAEERMTVLLRAPIIESAARADHRNADRNPDAAGILDRGCAHGNDLRCALCCSRGATRHAIGNGG